MATLPRISAAAAGAVLFGLAAMAAAVLRLALPPVAGATALALLSGWIARRPALRSRRPRADEVRSLVYGTLGIVLGLAAAIVFALPVARALLRL